MSDHRPLLWVAGVNNPKDMDSLEHAWVMPFQNIPWQKFPPIQDELLP